MRKYHVYLNPEERSIMIQSLVVLKNKLIQEGRYTDPVDWLLIKVIHAPIVKIKVK